MTPEKLDLAAVGLAARIGQTVRALRLAAGLTQAQLSDRTGILVPHVSRLESGGRLPTLTTLLAVADALGMPLGRLVDGEPAPKKGRRKKG